MLQYIGLSAAFEFDNSLRYEENDMKVTIENVFGFGDDLGSAELKSHKSVNEILKVAPGNNRVVMYYDFNFKEVYEDGLGEVGFINMTDGERINKDYHFVIWGTITEEKNNYSKVCNEVHNGTFCESIIIGTYQIEKEGWVKLEGKNIPKGQVRIGLATDVNLGDTLDGVWKIAGKEIKRHAVWTADLNVNLVSYYTFNDNLATKNVIDFTENNDATSANNTNLYSDENGIINKSFKLNSTNKDYVTIDDLAVALNLTTIGTWSTWINVTNSTPGAGQSIIFFGNSVANIQFGISIQPTGQIVAFYNNPGQLWVTETDNKVINDNTWHNIILVQNGTTPTLYIDGALVAQTKGGSDETAWFSDEDIDVGSVGRFSNGAATQSYFNGSVDETAFWNDSKNSTQITHIWNGGIGVSPGDIPNIGITLNSPVNDLVTQNQTIIFNTTISATNLEIASVALLIDGVINETNISGVVGNYIFQKDLSFGNRNWSIQVVDNETDTISSSTRNLSILDGSVAAIWTNEYQVRIIAGDLTESDFEINNVVITQEDDNLWKINTTEGDYEVARAQVIKTFFYGSNGNDPRINRTTSLLKIQTIDTRDAGKRGIFSETNTASYSGGNTNFGFWNCNFINTVENNNVSSWSFVTQGNTNNGFASWEIPNDTIKNSVGSPAEIDVDEYGINTVSDQVNNPTDMRLQIRGVATNQNGRVNSLILTNGTIVCDSETIDGAASTITNFNPFSIDFTINESVPETSPIPNITLNSPQNSIVEVKGGNITFNITSTISGSILNEANLFINGVLNETKSISGTENTTIFIKSFSVLGDYNWSVKVCDINDNCAIRETRNFTITPVREENLVFDSSIVEGELAEFLVDAVVVSGSLVTSAVFSYNETNFTTSIIFSGGVYSISSSISAPLVSEDTNITFTFFVVVDGITYKFSNNNQTVLDISFGICGVDSDDLLLNMTLVDELTEVNITGDIEISANIVSKTSNEIVESISNSFEDVENASLCFSPTAAFPLYFFNTEIRYSGEGYAAELYIIQRADMADYPRDLILYDLNLNSSTEFLIKYQDDTLIPREGAVIQLLRKDLGTGVFKTVEAPSTSNLGTAVLHIDLNTNIYKAIVVKDGEVLDIFTNLVFNCENELSGQCTHNLLGEIDPQNSISVGILEDFTYTVSTINNTITTTFSIPSGTPAENNIVLRQIDTFGNTTLCNQTIVSSSGAIDCNFSNTIGDSIVYLQISKDGENQAQISYIIPESNAIDWLGSNYFIVLILLASIVGMALSSPEWIIINGVMIMVFAGGVWLLNGLNFVIGLGGLIWLLVAAAILIKEIAKQEDR